MSDETNRAVQAPTHTATAVIYGTDASGMENQASKEERSPLFPSCQIGPAERPEPLIKCHTIVNYVQRHMTLVTGTAQTKTTDRVY